MIEFVLLLLAIESRSLVVRWLCSAAFFLSLAWIFGSLIERDIVAAVLFTFPLLSGLYV